MTSGYDESLRTDAVPNRYAGIASAGGSKAESKSWFTDLGTIHYGKQLAHFIPQGGINSFYFNGPHTDPYDQHSAEQNRIQAQVEMWSDPIRRATLDHFSGLVAQYGHTNSPGTLWALAQSGLDTGADAVQSMLKADATAYQQTYQQGVPMAADSAAAQSPTPAAAQPAEVGGSFWDVPQFLTRNVMSAAMMPLEAVQGAFRETGGILSDPNKDIGEKIGGALLTSAELVAPPVAAVANAVGGAAFDEGHQNPWEQTTFGQQLLTAGAGAGMNAFTKDTAGLDTNMAQELLASDPQYADKLAAVQANPALMGSTLEEIAKTHDLRGGAGWFVDESSVIGEAQRQSTYDSWAIPGPAGEMVSWTFGRGIASVPSGPDWAGYNFVSGLIDAVASIAGDPTIYGGKLGLVGKTLRGAGILAEKAGISGAETALLVGKEAAKVRSGIEAVNRNSEKAIIQYNAMQKNSKDMIDIADWSGMNLEDQIGLVQQVREGKAAQEAIRTASPSMDSVMTRMRAIRRAASNVWRGQQHQASGFGEADAAFRQQSLWSEFRQVTQDTIQPESAKWTVHSDTEMVYGNVEVLSQGRGKWTAGVPGEEAQKFTSKGAARKAAVEIQSASDAVLPPKIAFSGEKYQAWYDNLAPEDQALWDESEKYVMTLVEERAKGNPKAGGWGEMPSPDTDAEGYFNFIESKILAHFRSKGQALERNSGKGTLAAQVNVAATKGLIDNSANLAGEMLKGVDYAGTTLAADIIPGQLQRGIHDGADVMSGWVGDIPPVVMGREEVVTPEIADNILTRISEVLGQEPHIYKKTSLKKGENKDSLAGQVAQKIKDYEDPLPALRVMLQSGVATYGQMLIRFGHFGLDGYLDDFIRANGVDGIAGPLKSRGGVWMGDHPLMEHYSFPQSAREFADTVGGVADEAGKAAIYKTLPKDAVRFGLRSESRSNVDGWTRQAEGGLLKGQSIRSKENIAAVETARAGQVALDSTLAGIGREFDSPEAALRSFLSHEAGIGTDTARGVTVDAKTLRWFLFGAGPTAALRARVLGKMANMLDPAERATLRKFAPGTKEYDDLAGEKIAGLIAATNRKWDMPTYKRILQNAIDEGGEDGLYRALAPRLGLDGVEKGSIARGVKLVEGDGMKTMETWRTSNAWTKRWVNRMTSERPGGRVISLDNSHDVIDALIKYGMYAKVPVEEINKWVGKVALADGSFGAVSTNVDVLKKAFTKIGVVLSDRLAESNLIFSGTKGEARLKDLQKAMEDSVNLFLTGETGQKLDFAARQGRLGDYNAFFAENGAKVDYPRVQLESELLNGDIHLPSVDDWQAGMGRVAAALHRYEGVEKTYDIARSVYDNFFRTSLLVFRGAYIIRNSAEMQIRMFLNGHHSIFNDPVTLIGMTLSPLTKQGRESIMNDWAKYGDTILGDAFDAGPDKAKAFANKTEKYFSLIREAHSLTDPRVYQSTIYRGWQRVGIDGSAFSPGWANELIMLNNSDIARAVSGNIPYDFIAQAGRMEAPDLAVAWMLSPRADATQVRERLIAADDKFAQIFASESMTRDYMFDNPNSVFNRIKQFTMDDPALMEFVKFGTMRRANGSKIVLRDTAELKDRIRVIRDELRDRFYDKGKAKPEVADHFNTANVTVPWIDSATMRKGSGFVDGFFRVANTIERTAQVGPEFRMAYWDRMAELLPGLRVEDVDRAMDAAKTTLSPIQRMNPDGLLGNIGGKHPAWKALTKAKDTNTSGLMTLDELHVIAMDFAADHVKELFYDAARRNNFWTATRLIFPFGQAWGNTLKEWTELGSKRPAQVYKALKVLQGGTETGSQAIYETAQSLGAFNDYSEGMAPWDQDPNGGFFYSDQYGDTSFMLPYVGRAAAVPANVLAKLNGFNGNISSIDMSSNAQSANLALGSDSLAPGTSFLVPMALSMFPDSDITDSLQNIAAPYGPRDAVESALPVWATNFLAGIGSLPIVGDAVSDWVSPLAASVKNKNARDAVALLAATGNYDLSDPISARQMQDDANNLAPSLLLIAGAFKNVLPVSPTQQLSIDTSAGETTKAGKGTGTQAAFAIVNNLYQQMLTEQGGDSAAAKEEFVRQFGPAFLFTVTGNKKGYSRIPSSEALQWARADSKNMDAARAFPDYFSLFFTKGDPTDLTAKLWIEDQTNKSSEPKTVEEVVDESIYLMIRTQRARVDWMEANKTINSEQADAWRADIEKTYENTTPGATFNSMTTGDQLTQIDNMLETNPSLRGTNAGKAYTMAMRYRGEALAEARSRSGDPSTTLGGKAVAPIKDAYITDLDDLLTQYPEFQSLYNLLVKE